MLSKFPKADTIVEPELGLLFCKGEIEPILYQLMHSGRAEIGLYRERRGQAKDSLFFGNICINDQQTPHHCHKEDKTCKKKTSLFELVQNQDFPPPNFPNKKADSVGRRGFHNILTGGKNRYLLKMDNLYSRYIVENGYQARSFLYIFFKIYEMYFSCLLFEFEFVCF